jgi:hypothetical protein
MIFLQNFLKLRELRASVVVKVVFSVLVAAVPRWVACDVGNV